MATKLNAITHNVHEAAVKVERVQGDLDSYVYDYFFKHVICWTHGSRQALINFFFQRLFEECQELNIPRVWDEENGAKIVEIVNRLNFKEQNIQPEPKYDSRERPKRPTRTRRTNPSTPVHKGKPISQGHVDGTAPRAGQANEDHGAVTSNVDFVTPTRIEDPKEQTAH